MLHHRSIFLINRKFQFRFAFYVCSWLIALSLGYPLIISNLFDYFIRYLAADPLGPGLGALEKTRQELFSLLAIMQVVLLSLAFLISLFMAHKIAGPLYKLRKFFLEAKDGKIDQKLTFRKKDYFQELVPAYNEMMERIHAKLHTKQAGISAAATKIENILANTGSRSHPELEEILKHLKEAEKA